MNIISVLLPIALLLSFGHERDVTIASNQHGLVWIVLVRLVDDPAQLLFADFTLHDLVLTVPQHVDDEFGSHRQRLGLRDFRQHDIQFAFFLIVPGRDQKEDQQQEYDIDHRRQIRSGKVVCVDREFHNALCFVLVLCQSYFNRSGGRGWTERSEGRLGVSG